LCSAERSCPITDRRLPSLLFRKAERCSARSWSAFRVQQRRGSVEGGRSDDSKNAAISTKAHGKCADRTATTNKEETTQGLFVWQPLRILGSNRKAGVVWRRGKNSIVAPPRPAVGDRGNSCGCSFPFSPRTDQHLFRRGLSSRVAWKQAGGVGFVIRDFVGDAPRISAIFLGHFMTYKYLYDLYIRGRVQEMSLSGYREFNCDFTVRPTCHYLGEQCRSIHPVLYFLAARASTSNLLSFDDDDDDDANTFSVTNSCAPP
jgi:hypothetical protein